MIFAFACKLEGIESGRKESIFISFSLHPPDNQRIHRVKRCVKPHTEYWEYTEPRNLGQFHQNRSLSKVVDMSRRMKAEQQVLGLAERKEE